jgi:hypothetical protein
MLIRHPLVQWPGGADDARGGPPALLRLQQRPSRESGRVWATYTTAGALPLVRTPDLGRCTDQPEQDGRERGDEHGHGEATGVARGATLMPEAGALARHGPATGPTLNPPAEHSAQTRIP